jgi:tetratricopeptide (TPR) repeat protein
MLYTLFGSWAPAYHFFQLGLHVGNSIFVFLIIKKLLKKEIAFGIAILFLIHPINNEAVVFVSDMQETLFLFFGLLAFLFTLQKKESIYITTTTSILLLLSLLSKETGLLFLIIIPLSQIIFHRKWKIGFLQSCSALFIYVILRFGIAHVYLNQNPSLVTIPFYNIPFGQKLENIPAIILYYLKTFFFPVDLTMGQRWVIAQVNFNTFYVPLLIDTLFFIGIILLGIFIYRRKRDYFICFLFFTLWFFIGLFLNLQLFPLDATVATRWFYFPIIGLLGIFGVVLQDINFHRKYTAVIYFSILIVLIGIFGTRDIIRNAKWRDEITLYRYEIQFAPNDYILQLNYASALSNAGNQKEALQHILISIKLHPTAENLDLLALIYVKLHKISEAKKTLIKAIGYDHNSYNSYVLMTEIVLSYDNPQQAMIFLKKFLIEYPKDPSVWLYLAVEEYESDNKTAARSSAQKSLSLYPSQQTANIYSEMVNNKPVNIHFSF